MYCASRHEFRTALYFLIKFFLLSDFKLKHIYTEFCTVYCIVYSVQYIVYQNDHFRILIKRTVSRLFHYFFNVNNAF